jgi:hypothetical protein
VAGTKEQSNKQRVAQVSLPDLNRLPPFILRILSIVSKRYAICKPLVFLGVTVAKLDELHYERKGGDKPAIDK